jgi:hypothetical protein
MLVNESISFERGGDPKKVLSIGVEHLIEKWLNENIWDYTLSRTKYIINPDMTIDMLTGCDLRQNSSKIIIPEYIKFRKINGFFTFPGRGVESLIGWSPEIVEESYHCNDNLLISLDGCPKIVYGDFTCQRNKKRFSKKYVRSKCDVQGIIEV